MYVGNGFGVLEFDGAAGNDFAEIALFDLEDGTEVPVGKVGQVGMKSPTLAVGYWNDSATTYRTRIDGLHRHHRRFP